jgi:hypothetical protein
MKPVLIKWIDIVSWSGWNDELIEQGKDEPAVFYTVGFILRKTKTKLTISDTGNAIGNITTFPIGCVQEITELKSEEPNRTTKVRKRKSS